MPSAPNPMSRIVPRPTTGTVSTVTTSESSRVKVSCRTKAGRLLGGTLQRLGTGNDTETSVTLRVWRSSSTENNDFINRVVITLQTAGDETGQSNFAFDPPLEWASTERGFWVSLANASSGDEDYRLEFDVIPGEGWPEP